MDPAEVSQLQADYAYQSEILKGYQEQLSHLSAANKSLTQYIHSFPSPQATPVRFTPLKNLEDFYSNAVMQSQHESFNQDSKKCAFMMMLLMGRVLDWASGIWERACNFKPHLITSKLHEVFEYPEGGKDIFVQLLYLHQGSRSAADNAIKFRMLAAQSGT